MNTESLLAYSTTNVPVDDPAYRDIDKLIATGLVKEFIYGQRPWSRREFARMISVAMKKWEAKDPPVTPDDQELSFRIAMDTILARLKGRFHEELIDNGTIEEKRESIRLHPLEEVRFDYILMDSPPRAVPVNNGIGRIDAVINPFIANREGRHFVDGNTLGLETTHRAKLSKFFSVYLRPRFEILVPNTGSSAVNPIVQQFYGKFAHRNFELEVGRDSLIWGQGEYGGLLLSNNARPLDLIKLGTVSPFYLPTFFKYLGATSFQLFFAMMGPERTLPHSILTGYKWTLQPFSWFEIGLNHVVMMGGDGVNGPSFWEAIGEFTGFLSAATSNKGGGAASTNRLFSLEGRWTVPFLRNSIFYAEIGFDDTNSELDVLFEDNAMYYLGVYIPRLSDTGSVDLRLEYRHIPAISYRHTPYISGHTLNQKILADELGPDSDGVSLTLRADFYENFVLRSELTYERRDSDVFTGVTSGGDIVDIVKTQNNPAEHRWRVVNGLNWKARENIKVELNLGYERVENFNFNVGADIDNFLGSVVLRYYPY